MEERDEHSSGVRHLFPKRLKGRVARHTGGTNVGFWLMPMARGFVALGREKCLEKSNFREIEMANIASTPDVT